MEEKSNIIRAYNKYAVLEEGQRTSHVWMKQQSKIGHCRDVIKIVLYIELVIVVGLVGCILLQAYEKQAQQDAYLRELRASSVNNDVSDFDDFNPHNSTDANPIDDSINVDTFSPRIEDDQIASSTTPMSIAVESDGMEKLELELDKMFQDIKPALDEQAGYPLTWDKLGHDYYIDSSEEYDQLE